MNNLARERINPASVADERPERLTDIVVDVIVAGEAQYRASQISHHAWLIKRRAENEAELVRRHEEAERRRRERELKEQQERRDLLFRQARDWRTAQDIRAFVGDVMSEGGGAAAAASRNGAPGPSPRPTR